MYVECSASQLIVFSDIHGNYELVDQHLVALTANTANSQILYLGDAIDYWFPKHLDDRSDPDGIGLVALLDAQLSSIKLPSNRSKDFDEAGEAALSGKSFKGFPIGIIRRSLLGALKSFRSLKFFHSRPDIIFLLGNHELDLLSGRWYFRSLQKSLFLNLCGVPGVWCLEFKDKKAGKKPIQYGSEIKKLRDSLLSCNGFDLREVLKKYDPILCWLYFSPIMAGFLNFLFVHGGPTIDFTEDLLSIKENYDISLIFENYRDKNGFNTDFFCETGFSEDTIFAPKYGMNHFIHNTKMTENFLHIFKKKILCVGHSPFLNTEYLRESELIPVITRIADNIIKTDVGLKHNDEVGHHYLIIRKNDVKCIKFLKSERLPMWYQL